MSKFYVTIKYSLVIIYLLISTLNGFSQTKKQLLDAANKSYQNQDYYSAINLFSDYLKAFPTDLSSEYKLAKAYVALNDFVNAIPHLKNIYDKDRDKKFSDASFLLANAYKQTSNYRYAKRYFRRAIIAHRRNKEGYWYQKITQEINSVDFAAAHSDSVQAISISNLGEQINSNNADFGITFIDSLTAIFSTTDTMQLKKEVISNTKLYWANFKNNNWVKGNQLSLPKDFEYKNIVNPYYDQKTQILFFSVCDTNHFCKIYQAEKNSTSFINISDLNENINAKNSNNTQASLAHINQDSYLLFSSDREGGFGGMDIWYSKWENQQFQQAINAGSKINSPDNELTPFYFNSTLYFSSNWHYGFGGYDIFKSEGSLMQLDHPKNMLLPINSESNDFYFSIYKEQAYLSSNRTGSLTFKNNNCCNDIFTFPLKYTPTKEKKIENFAAMNKILPLSLYFDNDMPKKGVNDTLTFANYQNLYSDYLLQKNVYNSQKWKGLSNDEQMDREDFILDFFEYTLTKNYAELEKIATFIAQKIKEKEQITIVVKGYASSLSNSDYNTKLSKRRINSLMNYFKNYHQGELEKAIHSGQIKFISMPYGDLANQENKELSKKEEVYGEKAILERKIEIVALIGNDKIIEGEDVRSAELKINYKKINLGSIKNKPIHYILEIENTGTDTLEIIKVNGEYLKSVKNEPFISAKSKGIIQIVLEIPEELKLIETEIYIITNTIPNINTVTFIAKRE